MLPASPTSNNPDQNRLDMANSYKSTAQKEQSPPENTTNYDHGRIFNLYNISNY
jgi:hypothetical protein